MYQYTCLFGTSCNSRRRASSGGIRPVLCSLLLCISSINSVLSVVWGLLWFSAAGQLRTEHGIVKSEVLRAERRYSLPENHRITTLEAYLATCRGPQGCSPESRPQGSPTEPAASPPRSEHGEPAPAETGPAATPTKGVDRGRLGAFEKERKKRVRGDGNGSSTLARKHEAMHTQRHRRLLPKKPTPGYCSSGRSATYRCTDVHHRQSLAQ